MDSTKVLSLLEQLDDEVDDLEESLTPLLKTALSETSSKLPLLDKAKLYVLVTYAIESVLFSYLRLNGVNAREHSVFAELTRVKQYFEKIKKAEFPPEKAERNIALDKRAAARFITASLAGNDKYDLERAEQLAKERAKAHIKFEEVSKNMEKKRKVEGGSKEAVEDDSDDSYDSSSDSVSASPVEMPEKPAPKAKAAKKKQKLDPSSSTSTSGSSTPQASTKKGEKSKKKRNRKTKGERAAIKETAYTK